MKNKEFYKLLKRNNYKSHSNSGFTLTELLTGLVMSIFVIGALGFGLMQILRVTQKGNSETLVRNEAGRALDFISDEMRRSQSMEVNMSDTNIDALGGSDYTSKKKSGATVRLALNIPGVTAAPVIYSVAPNTSPWKGPLVIYRWGPNLDASGNYTDPTNSANWRNQALVDGISDETVTAIGCDMDGDTNDDTYQGFYACVNDPDGDGQGIFAQLYFTGETKDGTGVGTNTYSADTITVARARTAPDSNSEDLDSYTASFRTLDPSFSCNSNTGSTWSMRTDFGDNIGNPDNLTQWNHEQNRQPQPIKITGDTLVITSVPRGASNCTNRRLGNGHGIDDVQQDFTGNENLGADESWVTGNDDVVVTSHAINFKDPRTFNGNTASCPGSPCYSTEGNVLSYVENSTAIANPLVKMLKTGSLIPNYGGYDPEGDGTDADGDGNVDPNNQQSLGEFLAERGLAEDSNNDGIYEVINLGYDERIIAFEVGHKVENTTDASNNNNTGIDFQDNIFIVKSKAFQETYSTYQDGNYDSNVTPTPPSYDPIDGNYN